MHITDTVFYKMTQISRYSRIVGKKILEKYLTGVTVEEYAALSLISSNPNLCQAEIANHLVLEKGRVAKLVESLEIKGFVERAASVKNKKLVKVLNITKAGEEILAKNASYGEDLMQLIQSNLTKDEIDILNEKLDILLKSVMDLAERN
ncbi:MarR family transcriptional regulator [bacterium]|nr:MarR family transcriptional regulator [bacterium]